ncbi:cytidylyltransferase domain-containing protein [Algoriphagus limi]|uniref:Acylneuraminate cytidylyltransferase family protein n=1 Tax=Algoriphagus limi TaxID=2975273 RepID=A0ABT2G1P6_9BACT|nr:acylneuraminate cytidylyltransferase family protein [Algoriphagus limi]MCS5488997.1 acylneuraminate cytidylyltransferase family protein [Algoriphagus limi]
MRILAIIPARGGSKGIPRKNIKSLGEKPLLFYTTSIAHRLQKISTVVLSTEDPEIAKVGRELGVDVPFLRPQELAQDQTPTLPVLQHALEYYHSKGQFFDAICLLEVTYPFRSLHHLDQAIEKFIKSKADSLITVLPVPSQYNPHWTFEEKDDGYLKIATGEEIIISRRQELPKAYFRDGCMYLVKSETLQKGSLYGKKISFYENIDDFYANIDTLEDWKKAEKMLNDYLATRPF